MDDIIQGISNFRGNIFPGQQQMCRQLVRDGQHPQALIIACADSRVSPEHIAQSGPRGVSAAVAYAVVAIDDAHVPAQRIAAPETARVAAAA